MTRVVSCSMFFSFYCWDMLFHFIFYLSIFSGIRANQFCVVHFSWWILDLPRLQTQFNRNTMLRKLMRKAFKWYRIQTMAIDTLCTLHTKEMCIVGPHHPYLIPIMIINCKHRKTVGILLNSDNDISFITRVSYSHLNCLVYWPIIYGLFGLIWMKIRTRTGISSRWILCIFLHLLTMINIQNERITEKCMSISSYQPHTPHTILHTSSNVPKIGYATEKMENDGQILDVESFNRAKIGNNLMRKWKIFGNGQWSWSCLRDGSLLLCNYTISMAFHQTIDVM